MSSSIRRNWGAGNFPETLVLVDRHLRPYAGIVGRQIAPAQLHLVSMDSPAGEHRLAAVDGKAHPPRPFALCVRGGSGNIPLTKEVCLDKLVSKEVSLNKPTVTRCMQWRSKLFDAEYRLMELVWNLEPVNSTALARRCEAELGWKKSTVFNLIRKLAGRGS